jgi:hypothetical protein
VSSVRKGREREGGREEGWVERREGGRKTRRREAGTFYPRGYCYAIPSLSQQRNKYTHTKTYAC